MNQELRDILGKALQEKRRELTKQESGEPWEYAWEHIIEQARERDMACAEAVVRKYLDILLPGYLMQASWQNGRKITEQEYWKFFVMEKEEENKQ